MRGHVVVWSLSLLVSLAAHGGVLIGLAPMVQWVPPPAVDLRIADEAAFPALVLSPAAADESVASPNVIVESALTASEIARDEAGLAPLTATADMVLAAAGNGRIFRPAAAESRAALAGEAGGYLPAALGRKLGTLAPSSGALAPAPARMAERVEHSPPSMPEVESLKIEASVENGAGAVQAAPRSVVAALPDNQAEMASDGIALVFSPTQRASDALAAVEFGSERQSPDPIVEHGKREEAAVSLAPIEPGREEASARIEAGLVENREQALPLEPVVQSGIARPLAPAPAEGVASPVASGAKQLSTAFTLAAAAPHPAIILPSSHPSPDDPSLRMARFVRDHGGSCFLMVPRALDGLRPQIDGMGSRPELIQEFRETFRQSFGKDPEVNVWGVTAPQCAAVDFAARALKRGVREIAVSLAARAIADGGELEGALDGIGLSHVSLLLIEDNGKVRDLSQFLSPTVDGWNFAVPIPMTGEGKQLIVAVAADREMRSMKAAEAALSADFFPSVIAEAASSGASVSVGLGAFQVTQGD